MADLPAGHPIDPSEGLIALGATSLAIESFQPAGSVSPDHHERSVRDNELLRCIA